MDSLCELDEDDLWGFFLQLTATAPPETIHHVPFVLSHRRVVPPRLAANGADGLRDPWNND